MNTTPTAIEHGSQTLSEILSQPQTWRKCLAKLSTSPELQQAVRMARPDAEWTFVGCGTSYYLAIAAASAFNALGLPARAIPASELLLYPSLALIPGRDLLPVVISRSGRTSEAVRAAEQLEKEHDVRTIAITCADGQPLERACSLTLRLLDADEQSTVMTRSFTSMMIGLQYLAGAAIDNSGFRRCLMELPLQSTPLFERIPQQLQEFVKARDFEDCVFLAQGPLFGIASECMLKVTEASCTYAQVFHSLEYRHGPKAVVSPKTLIAFLISESSYDAELEVLEEMKSLGATTLVVANQLDLRARRAADFAVELGLGIPEVARAAAYTPWGQLLGVYTGLKKGLNPDAPKNLSRVVVLD